MFIAADKEILCDFPVHLFFGEAFKNIIIQFTSGEYHSATYNKLELHFYYAITVHLHQNIFNTLVIARCRDNKYSL